MESVDRNHIDNQVESRAEDLIEKLANTRILVVGDVMLDQYWIGDVKRISPEAPVPVIVVQEMTEKIGGAGNVARNITALDGVCTLLGIVGQDQAGRNCEKIANDSKINTVLEYDSTIKTTIKLRVISKNQQLLRLDFENSPNAKVVAVILDQYRNLIQSHDTVILSDYGKGSLAQVEALIAVAKENGKPVLIDPKGSNYSAYRGATMITPNLVEFESVAGVVQGEQDLQSKANSLINQYELNQLLVTLSDQGMKLFDSKTESIHIPARSREVYDVSGAGDTVIAVMAMALSAGLPHSIGMELANSAAGVVISKLGTATVDRYELSAAFKKDYQS